jgi:hypothetical protein
MKKIQKNNVEQNLFFGGYFFPHSEKPFAFIVCGKCLAKAFDFAFVPLSSIPFMKVSLTQCFV